MPDKAPAASTMLADREVVTAVSGEGMIEEVVARVADQGWCVCDGLIDPTDVGLLARQCRRLWRKDRLRRAGIGVGESWQLRGDIRQDQVKWLEEGRATPAQARYLRVVDSLRLAFNRMFYLGLFEFEGHLAMYPPGAFYERHLDRFRGVSHRKVSVILYLNEGWSPEEGGALRLYLGEDGDGPARDIPPVFGRMVVFWSERFFHEVLPAGRERMSLTGWLRTRE